MNIPAFSNADDPRSGPGSMESSGPSPAAKPPDITMRISLCNEVVGEFDFAGAMRLRGRHSAMTGSRSRRSPCRTIPLASPPQSAKISATPPPITDLRSRACIISCARRPDFRSPAPTTRREAAPSKSCAACVPSLPISAPRCWCMAHPISANSRITPTTMGESAESIVSPPSRTRRHHPASFTASSRCRAIRPPSSIRSRTR